MARSAMQRCVAGAMAWMVAVTPALAWESPAPDVVVYCPPSLEPVIRPLGDQFLATKGVKIHIFLASPTGLIGLLKHRARDDVVFADAATLATMATAGLVKSDSVTLLGLDPFAVVSQGGVAVPPSATLETIADAHPIVVTDPTDAASFNGVRVLSLALSGSQPTRFMGVANTPTVLDRVRANSNFFGLVYQTEANAPGVRQVLRLDMPPTQMSGALVILGQSANAAAFLTFATGAPGAAARKAAGLE